MRSHIIHRSAALALALSLSSLSGCADDQPLSANQATLKEARSLATSKGDARATLKERNPEERVGVAHNRMLDDFRRELRRPGVLSHHQCAYLRDFSSAESRFPRGTQIPERARNSAIDAGFRVNSLCQYPAPSGTFASAPLAPTPPSPEPPRQGTRALTALVDQIIAAIDQTQSSFELAVTLTDILLAGEQLNEIEYAALAATISVAQNSYEWWEMNYDAFEQDVIAEYGPCAADKYALGYSDDLVRQECLTGKRTIYESSMPSTLSPGPLMRECLRPGAALKSIAGADVRGAISGALTGAVTLGAAGAVGGAIVGGGVASVTQGLALSWKQIVCVYSK